MRTARFREEFETCKNMFTIIIYLAAVFSLVTASPSAENVVDLGYAKYQGVTIPNTTNTQFLGIRFAAPPTGSLRFEAPRPPASTPGIQVASSFAAQCLQSNSGVQPINPFRPQASSSQLLEKRETSTEDCLFLNVYVPGSKINPNANLPVIFWIHGGGYQGGDGTQPGNDLLPISGDGVIVVSVQYRLGVFGFLPGNKVKAGGALNAGLLDQQFGLQWTQEHISKFGGDPTKVTIWGQSAGAGSVLQHLVANGGQTNPPLFRAAITSSTFLPSQYAFNDTQAEKLYDTVVSNTGCSNATDTLGCLRALDVDTLQNVNVAISANAFFGTFIFVPVVDGEFIRERPTVAMKEGKVNGHALLSVTNTFEGTTFVNLSTASTVQALDYVEQLFPKLGSLYAGIAAALYENVGEPIDQVIGIMGESIFICPTYTLLQAFGGKSSWKGEFAIPPGEHGQDLGYYFTSTNSGGVPAFNNTEFDIAFPDSFVDFAMSLNPNIKHRPLVDKKPLWSTWNITGDRTEMLFNKTENNEPVLKTTTTDAALLERCSFWESVSAITGQ